MQNTKTAVSRKNLEKHGMDVKVLQEIIGHKTIVYVNPKLGQPLIEN